MGKAEAKAVEEVYNLARQQADAEMAKLRGEIDAVREESLALGVLQKIEYDLAHNQMLKYVVLHRIKQAKEYRKGGMTWDQFCEALGDERRNVDRILTDIGPIISTVSDKMSVFTGMDFSKIRLLGRSISDKMSEITEDGMLVIAGERIPLTPDYRDDLQAALEQVIETNAKILADKDATIRAKDKVLKDKQTLIERQAKDLAKLEDAAFKAGMTPIEEAFIKRMENLRVSFDGYMLKVDPERCELGKADAENTPRMVAAYLTTLDYMRKQLLAAFDTAQDMYGSLTMSPEEAVWTQPEE
jgi:hypothetical protein